MKSLLFIFSTIFTIQQTFACMDMQEKLGAKTVKLLKTAAKMKAQGLFFRWAMKRTLGTNKEYIVKVLYSADNNAYITLLGEIHKKKKKSYQLAKNIMNQYQVRVYEQVQAEEIPYLKKSVAKDNKKIKNRRSYPSAVQIAVNTGNSIQLGKSKQLIYRDDSHQVQFKNIDQDIRTPEQVLELIEQLNSETALNIPLEAGPAIKHWDSFSEQQLDAMSSEDLKWVTHIEAKNPEYHDLREERMSHSLKTYSQQIDNFVAIMGMNHVDAMEMELRSSGFKTCEL
jgi:hypothetical protein